MFSTNESPFHTNGLAFSHDDETDHRRLAHLLKHLCDGSGCDDPWIRETLAHFWPDARQHGGMLTVARRRDLWPPDGVAAVHTHRREHPSSGAGEVPVPTCWDNAMPAPAFVAQPDEGLHSLVRDLVFPGAMTMIAAPRGTGKSLVGLALAGALAQGDVFRGDQVPPARVLVVDRDNTPAVVKQRLQGWGIVGTDKLRVLTRTHAPGLLDQQAWETFPVDHYDVLLVDSFGAATEGVSEKEGRATQQILATLKDLTHRGLAVVVLDNVTKAATSYRGRGEKADMTDVLYEVRDITGWTPPRGGDWWEQLPQAGDHTWASRASRRRGQRQLRLAFIASKFRLGPEPEPFGLEVDLTTEPWTLRDITAQIAVEGLAAEPRAQQRQQADDTHAIAALQAVIARRQPPVLKTEAEGVLTQHGLSQKQARALLTAKDGVTWHLRPQPGKGSPIAVVPLEGPPILTAVEPPHAREPYRRNGRLLALAK